MNNADYLNMMNVLRDIQTSVARPSLTKREEFAKAAMQGLLANPDYNCPNSPSKMATVPNTAQAAVGYADALIDALNQEQSK